MNLKQTGQYITQLFLKQNFSVKSFLAGIVILLAGIWFVINNSVMHYYGVDYLAQDMQMASPVFLLMFGIGLHLEYKYPNKFQRTVLLLKYVSLLVFVGLLYQFGVTAVQYTAFPLIDLSLLHVDQWLHFNSIAVMAWTNLHPIVKHISEIAYASIAYEMILVPIVLAILKEKQRLEFYFIYALLAAIVVFVIYYFLPSTDPANVLHSSYFTASEHDVYIKYYEMLNHSVLTTGEGGLVSFPSQHVLWAIMVTYAFRNRKVFFIPLVIFNAIVVASTLTLGWHFLVDVIGSFVFAVPIIYFAEKLSKKTAALPTFVESAMPNCTINAKIKVKS